ncbi:MAG: hypothetical protein COB04_07350, partial [Gammaproteobacteria bacterium]
DFCALSGMGKAKYCQIQAAIELGQRSLKEKLSSGDCMDSSSTTRNYLISRLRNYQREVFACLFLDNQHQVICYEEIFQGTINAASVHVREVVKAALKYNAVAVILAHNHPSGCREPSDSDVAVTQQLKKALGLVEINVLDHIIVAGSEAISLAEIGAM